MIKIKILNSLDVELIGEHLFFYDFISIGSTTQDRIIVSAPFNQEKKFRLCFKVYSQDKVSVYSLPQDDFYKSDNKKISGVKLHKKNQIIEFADLKIKIIDFSQIKKQEESITTELSSALEQEFLILEKASHV